MRVYIIAIVSLMVIEIVTKVTALGMGLFPIQKPAGTAAFEVIVGAGFVIWGMTLLF